MFTLEQTMTVHWASSIIALLFLSPRS